MKQPPAFDPRLYLVTDPVVARGRPLVDLVAAALRGGVTAVQLRDKTASDDELLATALELLALLRPLGVPLIVNDRVEVALAAGADGVHVGPSDAPPSEVKERLGPHAVVGWSIEEVATPPLRELLSCRYVAASPVFPTGTKTDTAPALGVDGMQRLLTLTQGRRPLVGIGGIDAGRAADVIQAGARGVAVVSAILGADDPEAAARELRTVVDAAHEARWRALHEEDMLIAIQRFDSGVDRS